MKKSSTTFLTSADRSKRAEQVSSAKATYQKAIDNTIAFFDRLGLKITFVKEFKFAENYRFDYWSTELGLGIEFEGGHGWTGHAKHNRFAADKDKYNRAIITGYPFLRFFADDVDQLHTQVFAFYRARSKKHKGVIQSDKIDRLDAGMSSNSEPNELPFLVNEKMIKVDELLDDLDIPDEERPDYLERRKRFLDKFKPKEEEDIQW